MDSINIQIKKVIKLHLDSAKHYRICAEITTESDLIGLFLSLSEQRIKMANALVAICPTQNDGHWSLKGVFSYLRHVWYHMKMALIINNRQHILQYSLKNEQDMLQLYEHVAKNEGLEKDLFRQSIYHQQLLKQTLDLIANTSAIKFSRQKSLSYAAQKRA